MQDQSDKIKIKMLEAKLDHINCENSDLKNMNFDEA